MLSLTKKVNKPDEDDWGKLKQLLRYLHGTKRLKLALEMGPSELLNGLRMYHIIRIQIAVGTGGQQCSLVKARCQAILTSKQAI